MTGHGDLVARGVARARARAWSERRCGRWAGARGQPGEHDQVVVVVAGARVKAAGAGDQPKSRVGEWPVDEPRREAGLGVDGGGGYAVTVGDAVWVGEEHHLAGTDLVETCEYAVVPAPVDVADDDRGAAPARCGATAPPAGVAGVGRHLKRRVAVQAEADDVRVDADRRHADAHARGHQVDTVT